MTFLHEHKFTSGQCTWPHTVHYFHRWNEWNCDLYESRPNVCFHIVHSSTSSFCSRMPIRVYLFVLYRKLIVRRDRCLYRVRQCTLIKTITSSIILEQVDLTPRHRHAHASYCWTRIVRRHTWPISRAASVPTFVC